METVYRGSPVKITNRIWEYWTCQRSILENYFKIYKDTQVNEFFWYSCLLGGILRTKKVPQTFKRIWLIYNISSIIIMLTLNVGCVVWYEEKTRPTFGKLSKPILSILMLCSGQALFHQYNSSIEKYMDGLDKCIESMSFNKNLLKLNGKKDKFETFLSACLSLFFIAGLFTKYFLPRFEILNSILSFHYPFNGNFQTYPIAVLVIISVIQILTTIQFTLGVYCMFKLMRLYLAIMKRTFSFYLKQISNIGSTTLQQMESNHNEELLMEQNEAPGRYRSLQEIIRQRNANEDNFEKEMAYSSKQIWSLIGVHFNLRGLFENACTSSYITLYAIVIPLAGQLLWAIHNPTHVTVPVLHAMIFFPINVYLFHKFCNVGTELSEMLDQVPIEIYSTPWYMMSKKTRRTIHIMLAQTQYKHHLRIFKTMPIDASLLYSFLDSLYSNASFIHSVLERPK